MSNESDPSPAPDLSVERLRGNLARIGTRALGNYQYLMDLASLMLSGTSKTSESDFESFRQGIRFMPSARKALSFERVKFESNRWIAKHLFEDGLRVVEALLEDLRTLAALGSLQQKEDPSAGLDQVTGEDRNEFLRLPLAERLKKLEESYAIRSDLAVAMVSVAAATRCLRVRGGIVAKADTPDGTALTLELIQPNFSTAQAKDKTAAKGDRQSLTLNRQRKAIPVGQPVEFSKTEIVSGIFTLLMFVTTLLQSADAYFKKHPTEETGND